MYKKIALVIVIILSMSTVSGCNQQTFQIVFAIAQMLGQMNAQGAFGNGQTSQYVSAASAIGSIVGQAGMLQTPGGGMSQQQQDSQQQQLPPPVDTSANSG